LIVPLLCPPPLKGREQPSTVASGDRAQGGSLHTSVVTGRSARRFAPGSEWLYAKFYGGTAAADQVLDRVGHLAEHAVASGSADRWFFIRYTDPEPHLRVRFHGDPTRLHADVLPALEHLGAQLVDTGHVWRVQFDTYEREVERYGGDPGVELAEQIFHADSEAVLGIVRRLPGDAGADARWRLALRGVDLLFDDFDVDFEQRQAVTRQARDGYRAEFGVGAGFQAAISRRFRNERTGLEALLDGPTDLGPVLSPALEVLLQRSTAVAPIAAELRRLRAAGELRVEIPDLLLSFAHMHVNRMLRAAQRAQELVLYELLDRVYASRSGRAAAGVR
jgi:thiopeptide-type bacteriocin biosynthesis protein